MSDERPLGPMIDEIRELFASGNASDEDLQEVLERAYCCGQAMMGERLTEFIKSRYLRNI